MARAFQKTPLGEIQNLFGTVNPVPNAAPNYNAAPTDTLPILRLDREGRRSLDLLRWGLVPYWAMSDRPRGEMLQIERVTERRSTDRSR